VRAKRWRAKGLRDFNGINYEKHKNALIFTFPVLFVRLSGPSFGQHEFFNWLPGNDESVRWDPAELSCGDDLSTAGNGGNIQVEYQGGNSSRSRYFLTRAEEWNISLTTQPPQKKKQQKQKKQRRRRKERECFHSSRASKNRDRLFRLDIHLNVAAVPGRVISQPA